MPSLFAVFPTDRDDRLRRSNVVTRMIFNFIICRAKTVGEILLRVRQSVSVAHNRILADLTHSTHLAAVLLTADDSEIAPRFAISQAGFTYFCCDDRHHMGTRRFFSQCSAVIAFQQSSATKQKIR